MFQTKQTSPNIPTFHLDVFSSPTNTTGVPKKRANLLFNSELPSTSNMYCPCFHGKNLVNIRYNPPLTEVNEEN